MQKYVNGGITEENGNFIVQYLYDEWGNLLYIDSDDRDDTAVHLTVAEANPLRYRGYYYDAETGYYYLQSRYYDSEICRFINSDIIEISVISKDLFYGNSLYTYVYNNPLNYTDYSGLIAGEGVLGGFSAGAIIVLVLSGAGLVFILLWAVVGAIENAPAISLPNFSFATPAERADAKIRDTIRKPKGYRYWIANINSKNKCVGIGLGIDWNFALLRASTGSSVFAVDKYSAYELAYAASMPGKSPIGPQIDNGKELVIGYYWHYHPNPRNGSHIFYL